VTSECGGGAAHCAAFQPCRPQTACHKHECLRIKVLAGSGREARFALQPAGASARNQVSPLKGSAGQRLQEWSRRSAGGCDSPASRAEALAPLRSERPLVRVACTRRALPETMKASRGAVTAGPVVSVWQPDPAALRQAGAGPALGPWLFPRPHGSGLIEAGVEGAYRTELFDPCVLRLSGAISNPRPFGHPPTY